jgi:hypothetical protein
MKHIIPGRGRALVLDEDTLRSAIRAEMRGFPKSTKAQRADVSPADALPRALEHVDAASRQRRALPDQAEDAVGHAECVRAMHAQVKAADGYLKDYRDGAALAPPDGGGSDDDPNPSIMSPEGRQNRVSAAVMLHIGGATAEAKRLIKPPRSRK